jgi:hypothetical protein
MRSRGIVLVAMLFGFAACAKVPTGPETTDTYTGRATYKSPGGVTVRTGGGPISASVTWTVVSPGNHPPPVVAITASGGSDRHAFGDETSTPPATLTTSLFSGGASLHVFVDSYTAVDTGAAIDYVLTVTYIAP